MTNPLESVVRFRGIEEAVNGLRMALYLSGFVTRDVHTKDDSIFTYFNAHVHTDDLRSFWRIVIGFQMGAGACLDTVYPRPLVDSDDLMRAEKSELIGLIRSWVEVFKDGKWQPLTGSIPDVWKFNP